MKIMYTYSGLNTKNKQKYSKKIYKDNNVSMKTAAPKYNMPLYNHFLYRHAIDAYNKLHHDSPSI